MFEVTRKTQAEEAWFEHENGEVRFLVREITPKQVDAIRRRFTGRKGKLDEKGMAKALMGQAIVNWEGMKYRHLLALARDIDFEARLLEEEIPFSLENLEQILEYEAGPLVLFITECLGDFAQIRAELKEAELGNSRPGGSGQAEAKTA